jgi:hypothetical protein
MRWFDRLGREPRRNLLETRTSGSLPHLRTCSVGIRCEFCNFPYTRSLPASKVRSTAVEVYSAAKRGCVTCSMLMQCVATAQEPKLLRSLEPGDDELLLTFAHGPSQYWQFCSTAFPSRGFHLVWCRGVFIAVCERSPQCFRTAQCLKHAYFSKLASGLD